MSDWNRLSNIHLWNLNENSTRFDQASAAPTDDELYIQWIGTATIAGVVAFFTFLLMVSILRVPTVRNKSFNCYILAVLLPDFQFSLSCSITCTINAINRRYVSEAMCGVSLFHAQKYCHVHNDVTHNSSSLLYIWCAVADLVCRLWIWGLVLDECSYIKSAVHYVEDITLPRTV